MKNILLLTLLFPVFAFAQMPGKSVNEFKSLKGTVLHPGDTIRLARGSNPNGSFVYAYMPAKAIGSPRVYFNTSWANGKAIVKELRYQELKKTGDHRTIAIVKTNTVNGLIEIDAAEDAGEIITANNRPKEVTNSQGSIADELLKLKALLNAGAITQVEYDGQKAKLLK